MTVHDRSDDELVSAARQGDAAAMDALLRRHYDRVHAVCRRIAGSSRDADDAAQEAMIRIVRNLDKFDGRSAFGTWAYRIATNTSLDELRKRKRRPQLHSVADDDAPEPADELSHRVVDSVADAHFAKLRAMLGDLDAGERETLARLLARLERSARAAEFDAPADSGADRRV